MNHRGVAQGVIPWSPVSHEYGFMSADLVVHITDEDINEKQHAEHGNPTSPTTHSTECASIDRHPVPLIAITAPPSETRIV